MDLSDPMDDDQMEEEEDNQGPASPAQSGQDPDDPPLASGVDHARVSNASPDDAADLLDRPESHNDDGPSGSDQLLLQQPGSSDAHVGGTHDFEVEESQQVDDGDPQPGPSSACFQHQPSGVSCSNHRPPDDGSNSNDVWAASSSAPFRDHLMEDNSRDSADDGSSSSRLVMSQDGAATSSSSVAKIVVSLASFSPQPSSSGYNVNAVNNRPSQSSSQNTDNSYNPSVFASSVSISSCSGLTSSSSPNRSRIGVTSSSSVDGSMRGGVSMLAATTEPSSLSSSVASLGQGEANQPTSGSVHPLHGEISNPPSPLGGSRPSAASLSRVSATKRDCPDSPLPGPSGLNSSSVKRFKHLDHIDNPVPGPSGLGSSSGNGNSSEATASNNWERSPLPSPPGSPIRAPLTPADNLMISSSTGLVDSIPPTPVDIHGDNDLSVPSPNPNPGVLMQNSLPRRAADMDDMIDSTVDSCGLTITRPEANIDVGEFCQSSRYLDSSDDEMDENILQQPPLIQKQVSANEENISTSGQVDDGHFRLVPNAPEDEFFNQRHPPLRKAKSSDGNGGKKSTSKCTTAPPATTSSNPCTSSIQSSSREVLAPSIGERGGNSGTKPSQTQPLPDVSFSLEGYSSEQFDNSLDFSQDSLENPLPGPSRVNSRRPHTTPDPSNATTESSAANLESLLPSDLQLENFPATSNADSNGIDTPLSSTFNAIDSVSSFGPPVDLEDIQLQKFVPEQYPSSSNKPSDTTANANSSSNPISASSSGSGANDDGTSYPSANSKFILLSDLAMPKGDADGPSSSITQSSSSNANAIGLGIAFSGIPPSMVPQQEQPPEHAGAMDSGADSMSRESSTHQHSSILESMTGPLSKRLRTLHTLQIKSTIGDQQQGESSSSSSSTMVLPSSSSAPTSSSNNNTRPGVPPLPSSSGTTSSSTKLDKKDNENGGKSSSHGSNKPNDNEAQDNQTSNNNGDSVFGGTHQTYSVMIETTAPFIKPKQWFEQKSIHDTDFSHPWEDGIDKQELLPGSLPLIKKDNSAILRPKRSRKALNRSPNIFDGPLMISDTPVQSRARASLPSSHLAIRAVNKEKDMDRSEGVFAKRKIPKSSKFGPLEGKAKIKQDKPSSDQGFLLLIKSTGGNYEIDTSDEDISNWMMFVRPAKLPKEQNLFVIQEDDHLYYVASRTINPRQELRVTYAPTYATNRNLSQIGAEQQDDNLWPCFECNQMFESSHDLQKHLNIHDQALEKGVKKSTTNKKSKKQIKVIIPDQNNAGVRKKKEFSCTICSKRFNKEASLNRHLVLHKGDKQFQCDECDLKFSHSMNLYRHKKKAHYVDPNGNCIRCSTCGLWFKSNSIHSLHLFSHHPKKNRQDVTVEDAVCQANLSGNPDLGSEMKFQCPECLLQFGNWLELVFHVDIHGMNKLTTEESDQDALKEDPKKVKCELCYKTFVSEERLEKHMAVHGADENKPLRCETCGKRFLTNSALACHTKIHAEEKMAYDCPICGKVFNHIVNLKEHVHIHCVNGCYECPQCSKSFAEYSMIRKHIRAFHGEKKHVCKVCSKSFATTDKLKIHSVIHSEVKNFLCNECGKGFRRKDKMKEHVARMHSIEALQRKKRFEERARVEQVKEAPKFTPKVSPADYHRFIYKCHECLLGFKRRGMLVNHLAKRHPDISPQSVPELNLPILKTTKDYFCQYCNKVYKSSSKRKSHILKNHPGMELPLSSRFKFPPEAGQKDRLKHTFSATAGSVTTLPHNCQFCHKQYASNAKLLQHQRKKHKEKLPPNMQVPRSSSTFRQVEHGLNHSQRSDQQQQQVNAGVVSVVDNNSLVVTQQQEACSTSILYNSKPVLLIKGEDGNHRKDEVGCVSQILEGSGPEQNSFEMEYRIFQQPQQFVQEQQLEQFQFVRVDQREDMVGEEENTREESK